MSSSFVRVANVVQVPREFFGRLRALLNVRDEFTTEVSRLGAATTAAVAAGPAAQAAGLRLARFESAYNDQWASHVRTAGRIGI